MPIATAPPKPAPIEATSRILAPLSRSLRRMIAAVERRCVDIEITASDAQIICRVGASDQSHVADLLTCLGVKPSTLTSALERLEKRGLLIRSVDPENRRSVLVHLTARGQTMSARVHRAIVELENELFGLWNQRQLQALTALEAALDSIVGADNNGCGMPSKHIPKIPSRPSGGKTIAKTIVKKRGLS